MKNIKYILLLLAGAVMFSFLIVSCSNMLDNEIEYENLYGKKFVNEDGNKIIFRKDNITLFYNDKKLIFNDYKILVDNMISLKTNEMDLEVEEIRLYLLKDNSIYSTFDNRCYYI